VSTASGTPEQTSDLDSWSIFEQGVVIRACQVPPRRGKGYDYESAEGFVFSDFYLDPDGLPLKWAVGLSVAWGPQICLGCR
jgi:hypothetical protein